MPDREPDGRESERWELPNGKVLHRWTDRQGQRWACMEYDHGPLCRRCQLVDEVLDVCLHEMLDGLMEARQGDDGFAFRLTAEGNRQAAKLIRELAEGGA